MKILAFLRNYDRPSNQPPTYRLTNQLTQQMDKQSLLEGC